MLLIILVLLIYNKKDIFFQSDEEYFKSLVNNYSSMKFEGIVTKKFIDSTDHNTRKVIIVLNYGGEETLILDFEEVDLFNYIQIGDSLSKEGHNLEMRAIRNEFDTILKFQFGNVRDFEKSKVYDSLKQIERKTSKKQKIKNTPTKYYTH